MSSQPIPRIIHYCWFGGNPLPELAQRCMASWRKYFPGWEIREWNEENFDVSTPSGFTLEQFKKVLSGNSQDSNRILQNNAQYFYYIEKQYKINGVFVAAVAIHESNWGTSKLATTKNNLFGYGAYDRDPANSAYSFGTHAEGIDLLGRVFMKYYLNPAGTKLYGGEVALAHTAFLVCDYSWSRATPDDTK